MSDLISRQNALDALKEYEVIESDNFTKTDPISKMTIATIANCIEVIWELPSIESEEFEWCHDCKEYDREKHCCHRWTKVIRKTVEEVKSRWKWIPVTEALPEDGERVLTTIEVGSRGKKVRSGTYFKSLFQCDNGDVWTITDKEVIAWMLLPEAYRGE